MPFTSDVAKLPNGLELAYTDSGPVPSSDNYTTLILLHGSAFNAFTFEKMHEFAPKHNVRTVAVQRIEYPGSSKYTDAELEDLKAGKKVALDRMGLSAVNFIKYFVDKNHIPKISLDRKNGGIAIAGWSMGSATAMAVFSDPTVLPTGLYPFLLDYIKDLIILDSPHLSFGLFDLPPDEKTYNPWANPDLTPEQLYEGFKAWVSSYSFTPENWNGDINALDTRRRAERATVDDWTPEQLDKFFTLDAALRSEFLMYYPPMQPTVKDMTHRVFYDEKIISTFFPQVPVTYVAGDSSCWHAIWAVYNVKKTYNELLAKGAHPRKTHFITMKGANHFMHYDMPDGLMLAILEGIR